MSLDLCVVIVYPHLQIMIISFASKGSASYDFGKMILRIFIQRFPVIGSVF